MKKTATQTLLAAAFAIGTAGLMAPVVAQEADAPIEMTDEELDAALAELLEAELDACDGDEACIDSVLDEYEADLGIEEGGAALEDGMSVSSAAEGMAAGAAAPAQSATGAAEATASTAAEATDAAAPDDDGVLNSASEADEDSDGTGGSTRPRPRPD